jgi:hypothetical protein
MLPLIHFAIILLGIALALLILWTAPTPTARVTPTGIYLYNGHATKVTFSEDPNIEIWEKTVTPWGWDGGDGIDTTTMHNAVYRTTRPRNLVSTTEFSLTALYDAGAMTALRLLINREQTVTITYPDLTTEAIYAYVRMVERDEISEGEPPTMTVTIQPTNYDPVADVEAGPAIASIPGT